MAPVLIFGDLFHAKGHTSNLSAGGCAMAGVHVPEKGQHQHLLIYESRSQARQSRFNSRWSRGVLRDCVESNFFFSWAGFETDVYLRYETGTGRGIIFSRVSSSAEKSPKTIQPPCFDSRHPASCLAFPKLLAGC